MGGLHRYTSTVRMTVRATPGTRGIEIATATGLVLEKISNRKTHKVSLDTPISLLGLAIR